MTRLGKIWHVLLGRHRWHAVERVPGGRETFFRYRCLQCGTLTVRRGL